MVTVMLELLGTRAANSNRVKSNAILKVLLQKLLGTRKLDY